MTDLVLFYNSDYEPFAAFYWGGEGGALTKEQAVAEFEAAIDPDYELIEYASEPRLFHMRKQDEPDEEDYPWEICTADAAGATPAFGVIFDI
jgi:hypothetical protein